VVTMRHIRLSLDGLVHLERTRGSVFASTTACMTSCLWNIDEARKSLSGSVGNFSTLEPTEDEVTCMLCLAEEVR
jgi:hypothetical protein